MPGSDLAPKHLRLLGATPPFHLSNATIGITVHKPLSPVVAESTINSVQVRLQGTVLKPRTFLITHYQTTSPKAIHCFASPSYYARLVHSASENDPAMKEPQLFNMPLLACILFSITEAAPSLFPTRAETFHPIQRDDPPDFCNNAPDPDIAGLGVRIGLYLQIVALALAVSTGVSSTVSALPASIMSALIYNIILSMKASVTIFDSNPVVQDFWVAQGQLWLLVTTLPFMMLFGRWDPEVFGVTKNVLFAVALVYTYVQSLWFWSSGWRDSDEVVCGTAESTLFSGWFTLFTQNGRVAMLVMYVLGIVILLLALPNYLRRKPGFLAVVIRKVPSRLYCSKAAVLCALCVPFYVVMIYMVEGTVRRGSQRAWMESTGQWLALGLGIATVLESIWHVAKGIDQELRGGKPFCDDVRFLGGEGLESATTRRSSRHERLRGERRASTSNPKHQSEEDMALIAMPAEHEHEAAGQE